MGGGFSWQNQANAPKPRPLLARLPEASPRAGFRHAGTRGQSTRESRALPRAPGGVPLILQGVGRQRRCRQGHGEVTSRAERSSQPLLLFYSPAQLPAQARPQKSRFHFLLVPAQRGEEPTSSRSEGNAAPLLTETPVLAKKKTRSSAGSRPAAGTEELLLGGSAARRPQPPSSPLAAFGHQNFPPLGYFSWFRVSTHAFLCTQPKRPALLNPLPFPSQDFLPNTTKTKPHTTKPSAPNRSGTSEKTPSGAFMPQSPPPDAGLQLL